ncbi:dTDP-4-dehydrorhamnose 3,5-epimerase [Sphingomonas kaistensis]|uniref:dTDP-4-dehydrorhamnose 3,5-epimerase n=1 Tax=Sphingomonas kaistensis TaxID=298708 RepID=A0A7X5Y8G5_9SPHN|nr:dTDP-4-dehydrorhamnose 3,5-epimerase [Sphingomonas kaistensis]NJC06482.1 dTDP-4-dehydrorhamnose 3,5-epimerase [Sphingomonas kaistensis]
MLEVKETGLPGVLEILPRRIGDDRGFFSEVWSESRFRDAGIDLTFVQDNHSRSARGVLRGLHYQLEPVAQAKLVRVSRGSVFDVAVDIRRSSPTFGQWTGVVLSADTWNQLLVPVGFAHGFLALEEGSEVQYKVSAPYSPEHDRGINPADPAIGIEWPLPRDQWLLSAKDQNAPHLAQADLFE